MSAVTKACGVALALGGCAMVVAGSSSAAAAPGYHETEAVIAHTAVTVTATPTSSTITVASSNAGILAELAGRRLLVMCTASDSRPVFASGVSNWQAGKVAVWRKGSSSLRVTLAAPLMSGTADCGTSTDQIDLTAKFRIRAPAPVPAVRSALAARDPATSFHLDGRMLTVTSSNPEFLKTVQGRKVFSSCFGGGVAALRLFSGHPLNGRNVTVVGPRVRWRAEAYSATVRLPADISHDVDYCQFGAFPHLGANVADLAESPFAAATFNAEAAKLLAEARVKQLSSIHRDLGQAYRLAESKLSGARGWPSARALVKILSPETNQVRWRSIDSVAYAASLADATAIGRMYVVGAGTHGADLELAELDQYGVAHTLRVSIGGQPQYGSSSG